MPEDSWWNSYAIASAPSLACGCQDFLQPVVAGRHATLHAGSDGGVAGLLRRVKHRERESGLAALLGEHERTYLLARLGIASELERLRPDDALGRDDLAVNAAHRHFRSILAAPNVAKSAA